MIRFVKFQKLYGESLALEIDDLEIKAGVYWVKGVNGSGKSTLLKALAGLLYFKGDVMVNHSVSLKKDPLTYRRAVNFADAEPIFPGFLSGKEMIDIFISAKNASKAQAHNLLDQMVMNSYINDPIKTYSTGMIKKLSLALAFLGSPQIILLDEPLITLDTKSLQTLNEWIAEASSKNGTSFLLTSHQNFNNDRTVQAKNLLVENQTLKLIEA